MPYDGIGTWGPALATLGAFLCLAWLPARDATRPSARLARIAAACLSAGLTVRYATWRVQALPQGQSSLQNAWALAFVSVELLNLLSGLFTLLFMSRTLSRSAEADAKMHSPLHAAPTDVLIATYNEPRGVLERTIIGALDIDHPDLRVWVLDDGARDWVRDMAQALGALYIMPYQRPTRQGGQRQQRPAPRPGVRPQAAIHPAAGCGFHRQPADPAPHAGPVRGGGRRHRADAAAFLQPRPGAGQPGLQQCLARRAAVLLQRPAAVQGCLGGGVLLRHLRRAARRGAARHRRHGDRNRDRGHADQLQDGGIRLAHHPSE